MEKIIFEIAGIIFVLFLLIYCIINRKQVFSTAFKLVISKIRYFLIGVLLLVCSYGVKAGYNRIQSKLSNVYDNGNGTLTVVKYKINGDSLITTNIPVPVETYGSVTKIDKELKCILNLFDKAGVYTTSYNIQMTLDDGRIINDKLSNNDNNINIGDKIVMSENFYPEYSKNIKYLTDI